MQFFLFIMSNERIWRIQISRMEYSSFLSPITKMIYKKIQRMTNVLTVIQGRSLCILLIIKGIHIAIELNSGLATPTPLDRLARIEHAVFCEPSRRRAMPRKDSRRDAGLPCRRRSHRGRRSREAALLL